MSEQETSHKPKQLTPFERKMQVYLDRIEMGGATGRIAQRQLNEMLVEREYERVCLGEVEAVTYKPATRPYPVELDGVDPDISNIESPSYS